ncbi:MAG: hypothetical protein MJY94_02055 [Bacteroidales bacterium]|nr:hypothetical protein [Bacteroidales bacterium]
MKKIIRMAAMLAVAGAALLTSCTKDYSADIDSLNTRMDAAEKSLTAIQGQIANGAILTAVNKTANGIQVVTTNGTYDITNGKDGAPGAAGAAGAAGAPGKDGSVWTIGEDGFWYCDGEKTDYAKGSTVAVEDGKLMIDGKEAGTINGITAVWDEEKGTLVIYGVEGFENGYVLGTNVEISYIAEYANDYGYTYTNSPASLGHYAISFKKYTELDNVYPANGDVNGKKYTFVKNNTVTHGDKVLIRVSPTNAKVNAEDLCFINAAGEELSYVKVAKVTPYEEVLTRASSKSGLYELDLVMEENLPAADWNAATTAKVGTVTRPIAFAVAAKNANDGKAISGYVYTFATADGSRASNEIFVNGKSISTIHNRFSAAEDGTLTNAIEELVWKSYPTDVTGQDPKTTVTKAGAKANVNNDKTGTASDNRQTQAILGVIKGEKITIDIANTLAPYAADEVKGFIVSLDETHAVESVPSEINAWKSYSYENLGVLQDGNKGYITVNDMNNVAGDVIGFRVIVVNMDGTLVDPDGRAFYVMVGESASANTVSGSIVATAALTTLKTDFIPVSMPMGVNAAPSWTWVTPAAQLANGTATPSPLFSATFYKEDKTSTVALTDYTNYDKIKFVQFSTNDIAKYVDGKTYTQELKLQKTSGSATFDVMTLTANITKVLPTEAKTIQFRPKQEVNAAGESEDGTNMFIAYMVPGSNPLTPVYTVGATPATLASKNLDNVFYGLDANYVFNFATSKLNAAATAYTEAMKSTYSTYHKIEVDAKLVGGDWHDVTYGYNYAGVSTYQKPDNTWMVAQDYLLPGTTTLKAKYACWESVSTFGWYKRAASGSGATALAAIDSTPALQWTATGNTVNKDLNEVTSHNTYNNDYFGKDLNVLINTNNWLKYVAGSAKLTVNGQVNPYFTVTVNPSITATWAVTGNTITPAAGQIVFTQVGTQIDSAPVADHVEKLEMQFEDAFGHKTTISVDVKILAPSH